MQLLCLRAEDKPEIYQWIKRSAQKHISPENQNELLQLMAHSVLRKILSNIQSSPFIALMVDETTDKSNKEQLTLVIRWVDESFGVSEEFLGLYNLSSITAESIVCAIKDMFLRFHIPMANIRGQCYYGCSTMAGSRMGVAKRIEELEPRAVFLHCYGHALNLSVGDTIKQSSTMGDCLDTCFELVKLIKFSPKREAMLHELKEQNGDDDNTPNIRTLCPTR